MRMDCINRGFQLVDETLELHNKSVFSLSLFYCSPMVIFAIIGFIIVITPMVNIVIFQIIAIIMPLIGIVIIYYSHRTKIINHITFDKDKIFIDYFFGLPKIIDNNPLNKLHFHDNKMILDADKIYAEYIFTYDINDLNQIKDKYNINIS